MFDPGSDSVVGLLSSGIAVDGSTLTIPTAATPPTSQTYYFVMATIDAAAPTGSAFKVGVPTGNLDVNAGSFLIGSEILSSDANFVKIAGPAFMDVTSTSGAASGNDLPTIGDTHGTHGAAWGDYDGDGYADLYLVNYNGSVTNNVLLRNNADGTLVDDTANHAGAGDASATEAAAWGDFDGDGDLDLYIANNNAASVLLVNAAGTLAPNTNANAAFDFATAASGVAWADFDGDNYVDLFVAGYGVDSKLFRNKGERVSLMT